jgi:hypothetical protein
MYLSTGPRLLLSSSRLLVLKSTAVAPTRYKHLLACDMQSLDGGLQQITLAAVLLPYIAYILHSNELVGKGWVPKTGC